MKLKGKFAKWFYLVVAIPTLLFVFVLYLSIFVDYNLANIILVVITSILFEMLCIPILFHNYIVFEDDCLHIVFGLIQKRIPYSKIQSIAFTNNSISSLATSLDRIQIEYDKSKEVLISIEEKEKFVEILLAKNPYLENMSK